MESHFKDSEVLLMAVQLGAITESQLEECFREREKLLTGPGSAVLKPVHTVAIEKGYLTEKRILEIAADQKRLKEGSSVTVQIVMSCAKCGLDYPLPLNEALARPKCRSCGAILTLRSSSGPAVKTYSGPLPAEVARAMENPKNRFGKYVLLVKLGQGGMGEVFKAWDTVLGRPVALKMPRTVGEDEIRRLYLEAQGAGRLSHPNIASVYEIAEVEGRHYIAMQFIEGLTIEQAASAGAAPPLREIARWIRDAALAAHYAHERGVIHRDFKPPNLMIDTEGRVYVMDFGLAKLANIQGSGTVTGAILGTPSFMSPEQASGRPGEIDRRSDVYSLGATLYVLVSGKPPYDGETVTEVLVKILTTEPEPLRKVCPSAPLEIEAIVDRSMRRVKGERYATAKELAEELTRFLEGQPVLAPAPAAPPPAPPKAPRRRRLLAGVAAALAIGAGAYFFARVPRVEPAPPAPGRLAVWSKLFSQLQDAISIDTFRADAAAPLLARIEKEFPDQKGSVDGLIEREHKAIAAALASLPRTRWLSERPRVKRIHEWLSFAKRPAGEAERILAWRGTCTILIHVEPYAELRGPLAERLSAADRVTPLRLQEFEIADGEIELVHPDHGSRRVKVFGLEDGKTYVLDGTWRDKDGIALREGP